MRLKILILNYYYFFYQNVVFYLNLNFSVRGTLDIF